MKKFVTAILLLIVMLTSVSLLSACDGGGDDTDDTENKRELLFDGESYTIFGDNANNSFDIVYDYNNTSVLASLAKAVCDKIDKAGLPKPSFSADIDKDASILELLIGDTNRPLSKEAKAIVEANEESAPSDKHWVWLYKDGQLALYANSKEAYTIAISELDEKFLKGGEYKVIKDLKAIGHVEAPHKAYMEYDVPDNFFDGYEDPFGMKASDYKEMTVKLIDESTYRISYVDKNGGTFSADFVKKEWGMWMMGTMMYNEKNGTVHVMTTDSTEYEFVLMCKDQGPLDFRSGNHGNYPKRETEEGKEGTYYYEDDTSKFNDRLLDMALYDGKTGEKVEIANVGDSVTVNGFRIVIHHNIYERNYKQENVLFNSTRSYLYNGYDVMFDGELYATKNVHMANGTYTAMVPIEKAYGNCAMFYCQNGSTVFMKTPISDSVEQMIMGVNATKIDLWGENNPKYHITLKLNNPEDQLRDSTENTTVKGFTGFRDMVNINKLYCSAFSNAKVLNWGEDLHFNTTYSFSIQDDFVNPDRDPDYLVGVAK